ncbi:hypothetical protein Mhun_0936 [Methanospirillum hungatei JF-1]|uniref:Uncharacterized protein n=1 Tax=Methanospirillum hungatei JF-1 (strain ATCC 27890 / DSM 864 / NBRC 100397 / JF-1) TaxID=323259 RepID=Q2FN59_METHJ|nr:hypothetical protein [Methanospirillum hungatei]ABD40686.1 hypothetical protein Mhun_0936 [Methanospirillum hungatei JF-1]
MNLRYVHTAITLVLLILICGPVSAYYLSIDAPAQVKVGEPILVTGSTNTPPPDKIDIIFSHSLNVPIEIERQSIQITEKGETTFNVTFKTDGLEKGNYKVEGLSQSQRDFSAGSRSIRVVKLIDRSDLITFTSPTWQEFEKILNIEAKISGYKENAIQMEVAKDHKTIFGPESIPVTGGRVKYELPISEPGTYEVSFTDYDGFIGKYSIVSEEKDQYHLTGPIETHEIPVASAIETDIKETVKPTATPSPVKVEKISGISAQAEVSRDNPGLFIISTNKTPITIQVSGNTDMVFEYKTSQDGASVKVNEEMGTSPEMVTISDSVSEIYLKVYPYSFKAAEKVTITADTAETISLSDVSAKAFGMPPRYGSNEQKGEETPVPVVLVLISLVIGMGVFIKRK